jgi:hypothetical protein
LVAVEGIAHDGAEVARQGADVIAMALRAEAGFSLLEHSQWVTAVGTKEFRDGEIEVIDLVQVCEQQPLTALFGVCLLARACRGTHPGVFVEARAVVGSGAGSASARLVGAKQGSDQQVTDALGQLGVVQLRDELGNPVGQLEQWSCDRLEKTEGSFHSALAERVTFALRRVVSTEFGKSFAGGVRHVRRSLIGDHLQPFTPSDGSS